MPTPANNQSRLDDVAANLQAVRQRVVSACVEAARDPAAVELIAVSKTKPASDVVAAYEAGQSLFGENYAQELADKAEELSALDIEWHFIGPLQSNKTKLVANAAAWVHGVDRLKIAQRLNDQRQDGLPPLNVCVQVNISDEPQKAGVVVSDVAELVKAINDLPKLRLQGLMCIPRADDDEAFSRMQRLLEQLSSDGVAMNCLSMGMSNDFEQAIQYGATHVRVGTAIFGKR